MKRLFGWGKASDATQTRTEPVMGEVRAEIVPGSDDGELVALAPDGSLVSKSEAPDAFEALINGNPSAKVVTKTVALALSAVYACIDRISSNIAMMPIEVKEVRDGKINLVEGHDAAYLLGKKPNDWQTPFNLMQCFVSDTLGDGNGYLWLKPGRAGSIDSVKWFNSSFVTLINVRDDRWMYNAIDENGDMYEIFPDEMIHLRALGNKGRMGLSPIRLHAQLVKMGLDAQEYGSNFFGSGGRPAAIVGVKGDNIGSASMDNLKATWKSAARAAQTASNKTIFLPADVTYNALSISPIDAALVESMKLTRSEIAGIYNVPAYMIGDMDKANYSNITAQSIGFVRSTLQPWITAIEMEMNARIFTRKELMAGLTVKMDMDILMRGTPVERAQVNHYAVVDGWRTRNEVRVSEGIPKADDPELDKFLVSVNAANTNDAIGQGKDGIDKENGGGDNNAKD